MTQKSSTTTQPAIRETTQQPKPDLPFTLWIDADALPRLLKEFILKTSDRHLLPVIFVANQSVGITPSSRIRSIQVTQGADVADQKIVDMMQAGDIVVTQDIPLANFVIEKGGTAINPRGEIYTIANMKARLHLRDYMEMLRGSGVQTGGASPFNEKDKKVFADALEKVIQKNKNTLKKQASNSAISE